MQQVLNNLLYRTVVSYVDDCNVVATELHEMAMNLTEVLQRFLDAGLKLRPAKCFLFQREVEFCGHVISASGSADV